MGCELRLRAEGGEWPPAVVSPETFLERLVRRACLAELPVVARSGGAGALELRRPNASTEAMPAVVVQVEPRGFYVLDNDAVVANLVIGELVRYLLGSCTRVTIEEP